MIEDVCMLWLKLDQCLGSMQEEAQQHEQAASVTLAELGAGIEESQASMHAAAPDADTDPIPGGGGSTGCGNGAYRGPHRHPNF